MVYYLIQYNYTSLPCNAYTDKEIQIIEVDSGIYNPLSFLFAFSIVYRKGV